MILTLADQGRPDIAEVAKAMIGKQRDNVRRINTGIHGKSTV
jgi:hypothetical protein